MKKTTLVLSIFLSFFVGSQTDILNTDFQSGIPVTYTVVDNDGLTPNSQVAEYTAAWISIQDPENSLNTAASSTSFFDPIGTADRWLISPALTLGNYGNYFEWRAKSQDASYPDDYLVLVSATDNQLASFTDTIGYVMEENFEWTARKVNLSTEGYDGQTIYIAFVNVTENGFKLYVDDIHCWKNDPVGINENTAKLSLKVYPNPFIDKLTIETNEEILGIGLFSLNGSELIHTTNKELNASNIPSGIYFVKIITPSGTSSIKVLKN
jgi:hypothetical protein